MADSDGFESAEEEESPPSPAAEQEIPADEQEVTPAEQKTHADEEEVTPIKEEVTPSNKEEEEVVKQETVVVESETEVQPKQESLSERPSPATHSPTPTPPKPQAPKPQAPSPAQPKPQAPIPAQEGGDGGWGSWGGGWGSWAATSMSTVTKIAGETTKGLSGAFETFEASLGLPTPEELAREMKNEKDISSDPATTPVPATTAPDVQTENKAPDAPKSLEEGYYPGAGLWSGLAALSTTGTQYLNSGLDALEKASNQAYDALNYDVEGAKSKTRVKDSAKGANLMNVLQEAKLKYEQSEKISEETKLTMVYLFDEEQGLSQLEALEMLGRECALKMKSGTVDNSALFLYIETSLELTGADSEIIIEHLGAAVTDCLKNLKLDLSISKLNHCRYEIARQLSETDMTSVDETAKPTKISDAALLDGALKSVAGFSARSVELFKNIAELSLLKTTLEVDLKTQADTVKFLNEVLCCEVENIREQWESKMESKADIDLLFIETSNAVSYLQETLHFFVPVLKWILVKTSM